MRVSRKFTWGSLLTVAALVASAPGFASAQEVAGEAEFLIIGLEAVPADLEIGDVFMGGTVVKVNGNLRYVKISTVMPAFAYAVWGLDPQVRYVEPVVEVRALYVPNDPQWDDLYGMTQIRADEAWDVTLGDMTKNVCVLDTGIRASHEDLTGERWLGGYDYVNNDDNPNDDHGHGTHVTGTAAATTDNGKGVAGVAQVGMKHVKVLNSNGSGGSDDIADGMEWCADNEGHVISMSLGGGGAQVMEDGAQYAWDQGMLLVAAAGNDGPCTDCVGSPADYDTVMAITCTTDTEALCNFSSEGPEAELAAPGSGIQSTCHNSDTSYCSKSGTSMSTPHVAGVAALVWSLAPTLTNQELRDLLHETAKDLGPAGWDEEFGHGLVDAKAAVDNAPGGGPPGNLRPEAHAGFDHTWWDDDLDGSEAVTLDGTRSSDPDGSVAVWEWLDTDNNVIATGESPQVTLDLGQHRIRLKTTDNVGGEDYDTVIIKVLQPDGGPDFEDEFEAGLGGWTTTNNGGSAAWSLNTDRVASPMHSVALATYGANENDILRSGSIDLRSADTATFTLQSWMEGESSCFLGCFPLDIGAVQVSDDGGATWDTLLEEYADSEGAFEELSFNLDDYVGSQVQVRFTFVSDNNGVENEGWYIDDVRVATAGPAPQPPVASTVKDVRVLDADMDGFETVTLSAYDAHDPDGSIVAYEWRDPDGVLVGTSMDVTVTAPQGRTTYTLRVTDNEGMAAEDGVQVKVADPTGGPDYHAGFEAGEDGFTVQDDGGPTAWARTDARASSGTWSMALRNYGESEDDKLVSPVYDLISADTATLTVRSWIEGEENCTLGCFLKDYGRVQVSSDGGSTWSTLLNSYFTSEGAWETLEFSLDSYVGDQVQVRFWFVSDPQLHFEGWYVDEVNVVTEAEGGAGPGGPVAVAGADQRLRDLDADGTETVSLDGSASTDPDGTITTYEWIEDGSVIATGAVATVSLAVGTHDITLRVTDDGGLTDEDDVTVRVVGIAFSDDFESGAAGWIVEGGTLPTGGQWGLSTEQAASPTHSMAFTDYAQMEDDSLLSPVFDLSDVGTATLRLASFADGFNQCYIFACQPSDYGRIEVTSDGGETWRMLLDNYFDSSGGFHVLELDLDEEAGSSAVQLRFTWFSGPLGALGDGWYLDDIEVEAA